LIVTKKRRIIGVISFAALNIHYDAKKETPYSCQLVSK